MRTRETGILLMKWTGGLGASILAIWGITAVGTENYYPKRWCGELRQNIPAPGWSFSARSEAWAETHFGWLGLAGVENEPLPPGPKFLLWGDSFVEALHVSDERKMHRQVTAILRDSGEFAEPPICLAAGHSWWSVADYYFRIPEYERALPDVRLHIVHLHTLEDVFPDQYPGARVCLFLSEPNLHFERYDNEYHEPEQPAQERPVQSFLFRARLQVFLRWKKQLAQILRLEGLRFSLGQQSANPGESGTAHREWNRFLNPAWAAQAPPLEAWRFALRALDSATESPVLFVYSPATPTLDRGTVVTVNPERDLVRAFEQLCREQGFGFVSLEQPFLRHWQQTGAFPRGFHHSRPWEGHYNAAGHGLVAEALANWLKEHPDVVHPD